MAAPTPSPGSRPDDTDGTLYGTLVEAAHPRQAGRLERADALYRALLRIHPDNPDAHHNRGVPAMQTGRGVDRAPPHFRTAREADPAQAARTAAPAAGSAAHPTRDEEEAPAKAYAQKDHAHFETLARSMTQRYPGHGPGWKAVGFIARLVPRDAATRPCAR
jgi:tetratricopeptide (TPR) repeat protein